VYIQPRIAGFQRIDPSPTGAGMILLPISVIIPRSVPQTSSDFISVGESIPVNAPTFSTRISLILVLPVCYLQKEEPDQRMSLQVEEPG
jgi:hypothetical protein